MAELVQIKDLKSGDKILYRTQWLTVESIIITEHGACVIHCDRDRIIMLLNNAQVMTAEVYKDADK